MTDPLLVLSQIAREVHKQSVAAGGEVILSQMEETLRANLKVKQEFLIDHPEFEVESSKPLTSRSERIWF